jgi:hypothetical protein
VADVEPDDRADARVAAASATPTKGVAAISSAASELETRRSALERRIHGIAISIIANARSGAQRRSTGTSSSRAAASGSSGSAAAPERTKTSIAGDTSRTATRIRRYGIPQITHIAPKSSHPRRVTSSV